MKYFSSNLKFLRNVRGLSQKQILDNIGIEQSTWSNYERGKSFPNLKLFYKICNYLMVSETDLLNTDLSKGEVMEKINLKKNQKKDEVKGEVTGEVTDNKAVEKDFPHEKPPAREAEENIYKMIEKVANLSNVAIDAKDQLIDRLNAEITQLKAQLTGVKKGANDEDNNAQGRRPKKNSA